MYINGTHGTIGSKASAESHVDRGTNVLAFRLDQSWQNQVFHTNEGQVRESIHIHATYIVTISRETWTSMQSFDSTRGLHSRSHGCGFSADFEGAINSSIN
jgi:hypothetical protein